VVGARKFARRCSLNLKSECGQATFVRTKKCEAGSRPAA
jgi:hypothetical protein